MAQKMTGALVFGERTDRYNIRFDLASYYCCVCPQIRNCTPNFTTWRICAVVACPVRPFAPNSSRTIYCLDCGNVPPADRPPTA